MATDYCEFSKWDGTGRCEAPATKQVRVACPSASGMWCCDEHYEMLTTIPSLEDIIEF
jgi:hypothetical protein